MGGSVSATYRIDEEDFLAAQRLTLTKGPSRRAGLVLLVGPPLACLLALANIPLGNTPGVITLLLVAVVLALIRWAAVPLSWRRAYRADRRWQQDITIEASDDQVVFGTPVSHAAVHWAVFSTFVESERVMLLFQTGRIANILPTRAFTPHQLERLRELVRSNLPGARAPR
jgi:hypothetical protein